LLFEDLFVADVVASGLAEFAVLVLFLGKTDLFEDKFGDWVGEDRGNGEGIRLGLVTSISTGYELELEGCTIRVGKANDTLFLNGTVVCGTDTGFGAEDTVAGFEVDAIASLLVGENDIFTGHHGELLRFALGKGGGDCQDSEGDGDLHGVVLGTDAHV